MVFSTCPAAALAQETVRRPICLCALSACKHAITVRLLVSDYLKTTQLLFAALCVGAKDLPRASSRQSRHLLQADVAPASINVALLPATEAVDLLCSRNITSVGYVQALFDHYDNGGFACLNSFITLDRAQASLGARTVGRRSLCVLNNAYGDIPCVPTPMWMPIPVCMRSAGLSANITLSPCRSSQMQLLSMPRLMQDRQSPHCAECHW